MNCFHQEVFWCAVMNVCQFFFKNYSTKKLCDMICFPQKSEKFLHSINFQKNKKSPKNGKFFLMISTVTLKIITRLLLWILILELLVLFFSRIWIGFRNIFLYRDISAGSRKLLFFPYYKGAVFNFYKKFIPNQSLPSLLLQIIVVGAIANSFDQR